MQITNIAINNRVAVVVLAIILSLGGALAYQSIPKESMPQIEFATIIVSTVYPGASPNDIESIITQEIEREVQSISGIDKLTSMSTEGVSMVIIEFLPSMDVNEAKQEVRDAVAKAKVDFPTDVLEPTIMEIDTSEFPVVLLNMSAPYSLAQLRDVAEDLQDEIENLPNVLEVDLVGGIEREVQVNVDLTALQGYNLSYFDVVNAIQTENTNIPGGSIDLDPLNYLVRVDGEFRDPREIEDLVISAPGGRPIYVRDVAEVVFGFKDRTSHARLLVIQEEVEPDVFVEVENPRNMQVVNLVIKQRPGANIIDTVERVRATVEAFPLPSGTQISYTGDQSEYVKTLVRDLSNNIVAGLLFVISVLLFFLGVRNSVLVGIAIPLSMFIGFLIFQAMGQTLNFIILFSLIIALGLLIDNAIVVVENIYRFREQGHDRWDAARLATSEVGGAVVAATLTTVGAFIPMLLWPGVIGRFMSYLPMTLIIVLMASLFVALVINPVITGYLIRLKDETSPERPPILRRFIILGVAALAVIIALINIKTLIFLVVSIPILVFLHRRFLNPIAERFQTTRLPAITDGYRRFLGWMLERNYSMKASSGQILTWFLIMVGGMILSFVLIGVTVALNPPTFLGFFLFLIAIALLIGSILLMFRQVKDGMFRNVYALSALIGGTVLLILAAILSQFGLKIPPGIGIAGVLVGIPGIILFLSGFLSIFIHSVESLLLGRSLTLKGGLWLAGFTGLILLLNILLGNITSVQVGVVIMLVPVGLIVLGLVGILILKNRTEIFLTDNRARLLNVTVAGLITIIVLYGLAPTNVGFFPDTDPNQVQITFEAPLGTTLETSNLIAEGAYNRIVSLFEKDHQSKLNTTSVLTQVGTSGDVFFGGSSTAESSQVTLNMIDYAMRSESSQETLAKVREELSGIPGVTMTITRDQTGPPTGPPVNIEITGENFEQLVTIAQDIRAILDTRSRGINSPLAGLVDISDNINMGRPEFRIEVDRERAGAFGLSTQAIASTVRSAIAGFEAGKYRTGEREYEIMVRLREDDRATLESLRGLTIPHQGAQIPIVSVANVEIGSSLGAITRINQQRVVTVSAEAAEGVNANELLGRVQAELAPYLETIPAAYQVSYTGESEDMDESFSFLFTALLLGIALITLILLVEFNSIKNPFIIMAATALSLLGVFLGLLLTRGDFNMMTFIGIISLAGIVVTNSIVLVDYIEQLRTKHGLSKQAAVIEGGATRFRPVILTALTTIISLVPLTFGINIDFVGLATNLDPNIQFGGENQQFWGPMGTAIISGLTFATFLTLVIVPIMYSVFDSVSDKLQRLFGGKNDPIEVESIEA